MSESQFEDIGNSFIRVSSIQNQFHDYKEEINNLNLQIKGLVDSKNQMVREFKRYITELAEKNKVIHSMGIKIFGLSGKILMLDELNEKLKNDLDQSEKRLKELLEDKVIKKDQEIRASQELYVEVTKYQQVIKDLENELSKRNQQVFNLSRTLTQKNDKISLLQSQLSTLLTQIQSLNHQIISSHIKPEQNAVVNTKAQMQILDDTINNLQRLLHQTNQQPEKQLKASPLSQTEQLLQRIKNYQDQKRHLQDEVHQKQLQIIERKATCRQLQFELKQLRKQIQRSIKQQNSQENQVNPKAQIIKLYNQSLEQHDKYELQIKKITAKHQEQVKQNCELGRVITQQTNQISRLKQQTQTLNIKIKALQEENNHLKKALQDTQNQLQNLRKQTRNVQKLQFQLETLIIEKQKQKDVFEDQKKALQIQFQQRCQEYRNEINRLNSLRQTFELKEIKKILQVYIERVVNGIKQLKLTKKEESCLIKNEFELFRAMQNEAMKQSGAEFNDLKKQQKRNRKDQRQYVKGCPFSN